MNITETDNAPAQAGAAPKANLQRRWSDGVAPAPQGADTSAAWSMAQHWPTLVATLSEQAVESSNLILRALDFLVGAGRMRRAEAKALSDALYRMRDTSLRAQQITRLASGRIRQARDRVELGELIRDLLESRREEFAASSADVQAVLSPVDVLLDPPVAVSLVNNVVDWGLSFSKQVTLTLETPVWPAPARLLVRVATPPRQQPAPGQHTGTWGTKERGRRLNDGLHWMLLRQMAASANLSVTRSGAEGAAILTIEFPKTFLSSDGLSSVELFEEDSPGATSLLNAWVLIIAGEDKLRITALDTLRHAGIGAKAVASLAEARALVASGKPNALVVTSDCTEADFAAFKHEVMGQGGSCPVVEITERAPSFNNSGFQGFEVAKVGREQIKKDLGPTVLFELAKAAF
ncbi:MAG: hypothetical protein JWQ13_2660 [Ramlibacter sp.]|jgi:hypothetical protein|nr:hypothetical protein [Ramlibacter sp.]